MRLGFMSKPKLLIIGHGRHGKDTVCEILKHIHGFTFRSSSNFANERVVFPALMYKYWYLTHEQCYQDRANHRREWFDLIRAYNHPDPSRLVRELLEEYDIYCGLRSRDEFESSRHLFDYVIWVDRSDHLPTEPSCELNVADADIIIDNNGSLSHLAARIMNMVSMDF